MKNSIPNISRQDGAALVVGLIVLLIMTLLGVSSMGSSITELKMANNLQIQNLAHQTAVSAAPLVTDDASTNAQVQALNWGTRVAQVVNTLPNHPITSGSIQTAVAINYAGCMNSVEGFDISSSDQEGGSSAFKGLVHEIDVTATVMSGINSLGQAPSLDGVRTVRPGCPP